MGSCAFFIQSPCVCGFCRFLSSVPTSTQWPTLSKSGTGFNVCARYSACVHTRGHAYSLIRQTLGGVESVLMLTPGEKSPQTLLRCIFNAPKTPCIDECF